MTKTIEELQAERDKARVELYKANVALDNAYTKVEQAEEACAKAEAAWQTEMLKAKREKSEV